MAPASDNRPRGSSPSSPAARTALDHFRARTTGKRTHPLENALLCAVAAQLVFLPWAIGGMRPWSQLISLGLSVIGFVLSLLPRHYSRGVDGHAPFFLYTWLKLAKFPIFWLGLAFLSYIIIGALNPAWEFQTDGRGWWMAGISHKEWLPTGVRAPFAMWGPWRMLIIYASIWFAVCASWIGFTRRRSFQTLFTVLAANAFLLAALGIAQRALDSEKMFFLWKPPASYFVSSFVYKNHAGAYFNLLLALCAGLAFWHYERSQRRLDKSSPAGLFAFFGTAVAMVVFFSYSRTATILMFAFLLVTFVLFVWRTFIKVGSGERNLVLVVVLILAFIAFVRIGIVSLRTERFVESMRQLQEYARQEGPGSRTLATRATFDMARERAVFGHGAGTFRFLFPKYQQQYPHIFLQEGRRLFFDHAHNDYAEFVAEFGIVGCGLLALGLGYHVWKTVKHAAWRNPLALFVLLGCAVTLVHCWVDFNFYNPAIVTTWCVLFFGIIRWVELEEMAASG